MFQIPHIPRFTLPEIKEVDLSARQLKEMSDDDLLALLTGESEIEGMVALPLQNLINSELLKRNLERTSKPHWSTVPSFWLLVISVALSLAALVVAVIALPQAQKLVFPESQPQKTQQPDQSTQINSLPASQSSAAAPQAPLRK